MPPQNSNNPPNPIVPSEPEVSSPPPIASVDPAPTVPPLDLLQNPPSQAAEPVDLNSPLTPTAPPVQSDTPPTPVTTYTPPKKGPGGKMLIVLIGILTLLGVGTIFITTVLPRLQGGAGGGSAEIIWWGLWEDEAVVAPLIAEYQQQNPNVKITYVEQSQEDYRERLTSSLAQGKGPDIFRLHNSWVPMFRSQLEPMPNSVMTAADFAQNYYPAAVSDLSTANGFAGVPLGFDSIALYINEEIFDTYLKTPPATWDELRVLARELTIKDETGTIQQAGVAMGRTENVDHWPEVLALLMLQNNVDMTNPTGPLAEDALDFFTRFSRIDGVWNEALPPSTVMFAGGKLAMYFGPSWRAHEIRRMNPNLRFRVVPAPQLPKSEANEPSVYYATYWVEGVWSESKAKTAAWNFLKFLSTKESLQKFYQNASNLDPQRKFGEPYPRQDMASLLSNDPVVSAFVFQGKEAKSWYLVSRTFDGPTGINSQINKYFEDAVRSVLRGTPPANALSTAASGVAQVLAQYGLVRAQ